MSDELNEGQLENDLAEDALESKRGPGCPAGSPNRSTSRTSVRNRVRAFRERQRQKAEAEEEAREYTERTLLRLRQNGYTLFGELEGWPIPINASTADEELMLATEYATALGLPGIRHGQTIRNFVLEVLRVHCAAGTRPFNRQMKTFAIDEFEGFKPDEYHVAGEDQLEEQS